MIHLLKCVYPNIIQNIVLLLLLILNFSFCVIEANAQGSLHAKQVRGKVVDSAGKGLGYVSVIAMSALDTTHSSTDDQGIFILPSVKGETFSLKVYLLGFDAKIIRFTGQKDPVILISEPIVLSRSIVQLQEVQIRAQPTILYKLDTIEYRASDYSLRANDTIDELLKKADGFEVLRDGTLLFRGQQVKSFKLNGREFMGGDLREAIKSLPADMVGRFQVIDDYGLIAAKTGIRTGDPVKTLNITTRADRSIGVLADANIQAGNGQRYNGRIFLQRIYANQEMGITGNLGNTVNGVALEDKLSSGTSRDVQSNIPGTTKSGFSSLSFRDQLGPDTQISGSYLFDGSDNHSNNNTFGQRFSSFGDSYFTSQYFSDRRNSSHDLKLELETNLDKRNFLQIKSSFQKLKSDESLNSTTDNKIVFANGFENMKDIGQNLQDNVENEFGLQINYLHILADKKRNFALSNFISKSNMLRQGTLNRNYLFFGDQQSQELIRDSAVNLLDNQKNKVWKVESTLTYSEPLSEKYRLDFTGNFRLASNEVSSTQNNLLPNALMNRLADLHQTYNFDLFEGNLNVNLRFNGAKMRFSAGIGLMPYYFSGQIEDVSSQNPVATKQSNTRVSPAFKFNYQFSPSQQLQFDYIGKFRQPAFYQIQPIPNRKDPRNIRFGNPKLNPEFLHFLTSTYNSYFPNSRFNISLTGNVNIIEGPISSNIVQVLDPIQNSSSQNRNTVYNSVNEIYYLNFGRSTILRGKYSFAKQIDLRKYALSYSGEIGYSTKPIINNNLIFSNKGWQLTQRIQAKLNPSERIELIPFFEYLRERSNTTLPTAISADFVASRYAFEGKVFFKYFQFHVSAIKNYIRGVSQFEANPLVVNSSLKTEILKKRNLIFTMSVFDVFNQNKFVLQQIDGEGLLNMSSNTLSRFFLLGLRYNFQQWKGSPKKDGKEMDRRGDGSFIY